MVYYLGCYPQDPSLWRGKCTELHSEHVCLFSNLSAPVLCSTRGFVPSSSMYFESWEGMLNGHYILLWKCLCSGCLWEVRASQKVKVVPFLARSNGNRAGVADLLKHCGRMIVLNLLPQGQHVSTYKKPAFANRSPLGRQLGSKRNKPVEPVLPARGSGLPAVLLRGASRKGQPRLCAEAVHLSFGLFAHPQLLDVPWVCCPLAITSFRSSCIQRCGTHLWVPVALQEHTYCKHPTCQYCWWAELQPLLQL